ncbi:gas vesicle protein [bacterium]|nr:MAG: gas vesicle protein [bacterium]
MDDNKIGKGLFLGFLAGSIVGGIFALLYAPKSGKELRRDIRLKKDEFLDDASEYMDIAKSKASELINDGKKKSEKLVEDAKKKASTLIQDANDLLHGAKEKTTEKLSSAKETIVDQADRIKDAFKAGISAYNEEKNNLS